MGAVALPSPNVFVVQLAKASVPASTRVYVVAPAGKIMIENASHLDEHGKPLIKETSFKRLR